MMMRDALVMVAAVPSPKAMMRKAALHMLRENSRIE